MTPIFAINVHAGSHGQVYENPVTKRKIILREICFLAFFNVKSVESLSLYIYIDMCVVIVNRK